MTHEGPHKYQVIKFGDKKRLIAKCILPDCPHYLINYELFLGRVTLCHWCNEPFQITSYYIRNKIKKPKCELCIEKNNKIREKMKIICN